MKQYAIIKKINDNANCPAAHLCGCIYTDDRARRGIVDCFDTLEEANAELFRIALRCEDNDPASCPALWSARTWSFFCANVARLGTGKTAARTNPKNGCRYYHDKDFAAYEVVPVIHNEDNGIDQQATLIYSDTLQSKNPSNQKPHTMDLTERIAKIEGFTKTIEDIDDTLLFIRYAIMVQEKPDVFNDYIFDPLMDARYKLREAAEFLKDATKALKAATVNPTNQKNQQPNQKIGDKTMNTRNFSLQAGDKNSIFVWSSPFQKNFKEMPEVNDDMTVIVTNAAHPYVHIYNTKGYTEEGIMEVVKAHCRFVCSGCNYKYELIKKVGNCYFVN